MWEMDTHHRSLIVTSHVRTTNNKKVYGCSLNMADLGTDEDAHTRTHIIASSRCMMAAMLQHIPIVRR